MRPAVFLSVLLLTAASLLGAGRRRAVDPVAPVIRHLDPRRSFAITDQAILDGFSFRRVMQAIVDRSGTSTSAAALVEQMFDTQNPKRAASTAPHCNDFLIDGQPSFNGLPRRCPTPEGTLATRDPFANDDYIPIAVLNRFDQTPPNGANCGQYRLIFAKRPPNPSDRLHLIFEAVLPNPRPEAGIVACRPVAEFWARLSDIGSIAVRRAMIEQFFFTGIDGFPPVLDPDHYSLASGGGIRTLENTAGSTVAARFYQFRLAKHGNQLIAEPDVLDDMPFGRFFDTNDDTPAARAFRDAFIREIEHLATDDVNLYFMNIPRQFLMVESDPLDGEFAFSYRIPMQRGNFATGIAAELRRIGSSLTPDEVIMRAETQSCVGCHILFGPIGQSLEFPRGIDSFQHVSENFVEPGEAGPRYSISPAMQNEFIPHRMDILLRFLAAGTPPVHSN